MDYTFYRLGEIAPVKPKGKESTTTNVALTDGEFMTYKMFEDINIKINKLLRGLKI